MRSSLFLAALTSALVFSTGAGAQGIPAVVPQVASVEGVTEYQLPNGLRVLLFPDPAKATTTVNIVYLVGSRHEDYGESGMAHLIEHLVSFGSPRHPDAKAEQVARGAQRNASTSYDRTNYYESFPASDENLEWALDLEADRMRGALVRRDILASQMSVVRNEMEAGENDPVRMLGQRVRSTAYLWHNYGRATIGARSDVENVPIERLQAFYQRYYHPNNAVLIIAGKFETNRALTLVAQKFGALPRSPQPIAPTYTAEPTQDGERSVTLRRTGDTQLVSVGYHLPAGSHPDLGALRIVLDVLAGQPNGRLYRQLVETKQAASLGGYASGLREAGYALITAVVRKEQSLDAVRARLLETLDRLTAEPPTAEEVERSRAKLLRQVDLSLADSSAVSFALGEAAATGDWRLLFLQRDWVRQARREDVLRVAQAYLVPSNRTVGLFVPEAEPARAEIPPPPPLDTLVTGYKGDAAVSAGEAIEPDPAVLERRIVRAQLPGGLKLALLPKKTRGEVVRAELALRFGDVASLTGRHAAAQAAGALLTRGTATRTRQQIADELTRLRSRLYTTGGPGVVTLNFETVRASLPDLMRLAAELLRTPAFTTEEFERYQQERLAAYEAERSSPGTLASLTLQRQLRPFPPGDPRAVELPDESIAALKALTVDDVRRFWREFVGASFGEWALVGDFDAAEVQALAASVLADWQTPRPYQEWSRPYVARPAVNLTVDTPDKANAQFNAGMLLAVTDQHPDYPALVLAGYMLGGHSASRLYLRIRGKEGLSYGASAAITALPRDALATFTAAAIANPPNIAKVEAAFREEIERALRDGFAADEVATAKNGWLQSRRVQRAQDSSLVAMLQTQARYGRTMAFTEKLDRAVGELTAEQVNAALRRHLRLDSISIVKAGDFKRVTTTP